MLNRRIIKDVYYYKFAGDEEVHMAKAAKRVDDKGRKLPDGFSQRSDGRYQARFTFNGKRYTYYGKNLAELKVRVNRIQTSFHDAIYSNLENITMNQWFKKWIDIYKKDKLKPVTLYNYQSYWKWYVADTIGGMQVNRLKRIHMITFYNDLLNGEKKLAIGTVKYINNIIYCMLEQAVYNDIIHRNPVYNVLREIETPQTKEKEALTVEEQSRFFEYIDGHRFFDRYKPMFTIAFGTGLRVEELTALTWDDIDFENETINIDKTLHKTKFLTENNNRYLINTPKTKNAIRKVPMLPEVKKAFKLQKQYLDSLSIRCNIEINGYSDFVFCTQNGHPYYADLVNIEIRRIIKVQKTEEDILAKEENREPVYLKDFTPHIMRHSFASRCYEAGMDPKILQKIMGHAKINTTMDIYTHISESRTKKEMSILESVVIS
ncbi:site-specific integrase [Firmicutes bacterium OM07-11]|nr:site-specific integrase [Firmicutes bacterium OM07-11]